ncbi:oxygenase MpaB family protein [Hoyosella altamirensis]|uniref:Uncharacterized protein (DUF2236 family) n=1 Tax=Hoyosella altamirensis TaxID=616997 RepID=A0A839RL54_9ACTN|nr:oxygenase MpaB family protein [Hoyosella altamirensis]MBB3037107.1 uncharacterized protein (DUF2236 family) [Hoyosella altamirensis]
MTAVRDLSLSQGESDRFETVSPGSITVKAIGDWRLLLLSVNALVLQAAHPVIGAGVEDHSIYKTDPFRRLDRSWYPTVALAFYGSKSVEYGRDLRAAHKRIGGVDHLGRRYHAWDPEAMFLTLATGFEAIEKTAELFGDPLTPQQLDDVYADIRRMCALVGIPDRAMPSDVPAYRAWFETMVNERLEDHPAAHEVLDLLGHLGDYPPPLPLPAFLWRPIGNTIGAVMELVTVGTLNPVMRERLGRNWTASDQRRLEIFAVGVRTVNKILPTPLRQISKTLALRRQPAITAEIARQAATAVPAPTCPIGAHGQTGT